MNVLKYSTLDEYSMPIWLNLNHFLKEINTFIQQGCIKLIKSDSKDLQYIFFLINAVLLNFLFIKESWKIKYITFSTKIWSSTTVFNIDNNQKWFLSSKSVYYNDFWRSCDTEDWSNDAENTDLITEINYIWQYIHIVNTYFKL